MKKTRTELIAAYIAARKLLDYDMMDSIRAELNTLTFKKETAIQQLALENRLVAAGPITSRRKS